MQSTVLHFYHAACAVLMAHDVYIKQLLLLRPHRCTLRGVTELETLRGQKPEISDNQQKKKEKS